MKNKKYLIGGLIVFLLFIGAEVVGHYLYIRSSDQRLENCLTYYQDREQSGHQCHEITSAANAAFSSATARDIPTYLFIFFVILFLSTRMDKAETRIGELEKKLDGANA